ncbi:MAG: TetR/AcrR family transcriptional regulator [Acidimicrobiia bacterium]|nr:TetR/AcrR family transcriptional regulator [Acidimicrobiia bacterium]
MLSDKDTEPLVGDGSDRRSKSDQTTQRLLDAAAEEFMEHGYEGSRISRIARRAGLTSGAVYARWPHKPDVLAAALDHILRQELPEEFGAERFGLNPFVSDPPDPVAIMRLLGAGRLDRGEHRDVMVQAFGSARNNEAIRACLVGFLNEEARRLCELIEVGKEQGYCEEAFSTPALTLLWHSIILGSQLLVSAGLDERYVPDDDDWTALLWTVVCAVCPGAQPIE